jgi:mono/diheme cytochrome c family protein
MRLSTLLVFLLGSALLPAQEQKPVINKVPVTRTSATSGKEMFAAYCAACHGLGAKGDGPAAAAFKKTPRDLTRLAQDNGGKFPEAMVHATLKLQEGTVHGSTVMPVWGPLLSSASSSQAETELRITNLVRYIETLQAH